MIATYLQATICFLRVSKISKLCMSVAVNCLQPKSHTTKTLLIYIPEMLYHLKNAASIATWRGFSCIWLYVTIYWTQCRLHVILETLNITVYERQLALGRDLIVKSSSSMRQSQQQKDLTLRLNCWSFKTNANLHLWLWHKPVCTIMKEMIRLSRYCNHLSWFWVHLKAQHPTNSDIETIFSERLNIAMFALRFVGVF